jgi:hypothetical protein
VNEKKYRKPTMEEALECVCRPTSNKAFRNHCIEYWREAYGDQYANEVNAKAIQILRKRKESP